MKKFVTILLSLAILCTMTVTAFAESPVTALGGSDTCTVTGKYIAALRTDVYKVDITWGGMEFDYNEAGEEWNTESHTWDTVGTEGWVVKTGSSNTISFANHSSKSITVTLALSDKAANVDGVFKDNATNTVIAGNSFGMSAANSGTGASTYTASFMPTGTLADSFTDYAQIGTITVTIS